MYESPAAFERAIKKAIKQSGREPGNAYRQMLRDRFLCRVFGSSDYYVLKGGSGMLARIADSRATRDIDLALSKPQEPSEVLDELKALVSKDLGDWCRFELDRIEETLDENGYSRLLKLRFTSAIGEEEKDPILIDLSLDCEMTDTPERLTPLNRVPIEGICESSYLMYPLVDQIADKVCAGLELYPGGYPSSRVKDLVDLALIAFNESVSGNKLQHALQSEFTKRNLECVHSFNVPQDWARTYPHTAKGTSMPEKYQKYAPALRLVQTMIEPALQDRVRNKSWNPQQLTWVDR